MRIRILFVFLAISPMTGLGEIGEYEYLTDKSSEIGFFIIDLKNSKLVEPESSLVEKKISETKSIFDDFENKKSELARLIDGGGFEIRVIAEKHQSAQNGLVFSVELENKLDESVSFTIFKNDKMQTILKENDVSFQYSIHASPIPVVHSPSFSTQHDRVDKLNLASYNDFNVLVTRGLIIIHRIDIEGHSVMQLGSVEFSNYFVYGEVKDGEFIKQTIAPGSYVIRAMLAGQVITDPPKPGVDEYTWRSFLVDSKPVEVVLE